MAAVVVAGIFGLCAEWQRRKTFVALVNGAAPGTVIKQEDGRGRGRRCMTVTTPKAASEDGRSRGALKRLETLRGTIAPSLPPGATATLT